MPNAAAMPPMPIRMFQLPSAVMNGICDPAKLQAALASSEYVRIYQQYVDAYRLGYEVTTASRSDFPGYQGSIDLRYATPLERPR